MSPKIVDKEQKRRSIVEASLRVFARNGNEATRTIDIAKEAGIGKGTIYEYFRSKEEIIEAIFAYLFFNYEQQLQELAQESKPPIEAILESFRQMMEEADEYADLIPVYFQLWSSKSISERLGLDRQMSDWFEKLSNSYTAIIVKGQETGEIDAKIDAPALSRTLVGAIDGIVLHYCLFQPSKSFFQRQQKELERMVRSVLNS